MQIFFFIFQKLNVPMEKSWSRMTAARCAHLMIVAAANKLHEAWVSPNPELFYCYMFQYTPYFAKKWVIQSVHIYSFIISVDFSTKKKNKYKKGILTENTTCFGNKPVFSRVKDLKLFEKFVRFTTECLHNCWNMKRFNFGNLRKCCIGELVVLLSYFSVDINLRTMCLCFRLAVKLGQSRMNKVKAGVGNLHWPSPYVPHTWTGFRLTTKRVLTRDK